MNAIVGDNGILTQAQNAAVASKKATILEELNMELTKYNIGSFTNENTGAREMITDLLNKDLIDGVLASSGEYVQDANTGIGVPLFDTSNNYTGQIQYPVAKDEFSLVIYAGSDGTYKAEFGEVTMSSGGTVSSGTVMVTEDKFNNSAEDENDKGKFEITGDASVMFVDEVSGELSISVKSGAHAKVNIFKNMTLTNAGLKRSAIDIENGGILDIYIAEGVTVTVDSGMAIAATAGNPGKGGYAGIHVPEGSTLNLYGKGIINSRGGDASIGETPTNSSYVSGGGGAGSGIGGNGGNGGLGKSGSSESGKSGENAGVVNIYNNISVYAYGGAGGSATVGKGENSGAGGGYPGAGIGGGGAGAGGSSCCSGSGGYSGGGADVTQDYDKTKLIVNGNVADISHTSFWTHHPQYWGTNSSSYYFGGQLPYNSSLQSKYSYKICINSDQNNEIIGLGGLGGCGESLGHLAGNGGQAGKGAQVKTSSNAKIYAFNGNRYTDGTSYENGKNEAPIYAQMGILPSKYAWKSGNRVELEKVSENGNIEKVNYINELMINKKVTINNNVSFLTNIDLSIQGIGSGAGYIEVSNGTYIVDNNMN